MDKRREENKGLSKEERKKKREENRGDSRGNKDSSENEDGDKNQIAQKEDAYKNQPYGMGDGRYANASPEQKEKMEKHREMMRSLSPEKRELVKKEMDRHRAEMKKITGFDLSSPGNPDQQNERPE